MPTALCARTELPATNVRAQKAGQEKIVIRVSSMVSRSIGLDNSIHLPFSKQYMFKK